MFPCQLVAAYITHNTNYKGDNAAGDWDILRLCGLELQGSGNATLPISFVFKRSFQL